MSNIVLNREINLSVVKSHLNKKNIEMRYNLIEKIKNEQNES